MSDSCDSDDDRLTEHQKRQNQSGSDEETLLQPKRKFQRTFFHNTGSTTDDTTSSEDKSDDSTEDINSEESDPDWLTRLQEPEENGTRQQQTDTNVYRYGMTQPHLEDSDYDGSDLQLQPPHEVHHTGVCLDDNREQDTQNNAEWVFNHVRPLEMLSDMSNDSNSDESVSSNSDMTDEEDSLHSLSADDESDEESENDMKSLEIQMAMIVSFISKHKLKSNITSDLIEMINVLLSLETGQERNQPLTMKMLKQYMDSVKYPIVKHHYCTKCNTTVEDGQESCGSCNENLLLQGNKSFFVTMSIANQVEAILKQRSLYDDIVTPHLVNPNGSVGDFKDGTIYQRFLTQHVLPDDTDDTIHLGFIFNTDGVRVFKSNKYDIWPIYLSIVQLSSKNRFQPNNLILSTVWHGPKKPQLHLFMKPFFLEMTELARGIRIETAEGEKTLKAFVLAATMDLPARALETNMMLFNALESCPRCYHPGEILRTVAGGSVHVYCAKHRAELRTDEQILQDARNAIERSEVVRGFKGPSPLNHLPAFKPSIGYVTDCMHGPFLGLTLQLLKLWFDATHREQPFSVHEMAPIFSARMCSIKPPMSVKRYPRGLEHLGHYKASELCMILIMYIPVLYGLISEARWRHVTRLSSALYILYQPNITRSEMVEAEDCLTKFCNDFEELYGKRYQTTNFHNLSHLIADAKNAGSLWNTDCFCYENASGQLLKYLHGTRHIPNQIVSAISMTHKLPNLHQDFDNAEVVGFLKSMFDNHNWAKEEISLGEDMFVLGSTIKKVPEAEYLELTNTYLLQLLPYAPVNTVLRYTFLRFRIKQRVFHCREYTRVSKRNSYTVQYLDDGVLKYGFVLKGYVLEVDDGVNGVQEVVCAKIICLNVMEENLAKAKHIKGVSKPIDYTKIKLIHLKDIKRLCVFLDFSGIRNRCFLSLVPNISHVI